MDPRSARAFTLIELLVVVAILGVLLALLLPRLRPPAGQTAEHTFQKLSLGVSTLKTDLGIPVGDFLAVDGDGRALPTDAEGWHIWTDGAGATHRFEIGRELDPTNPAWAATFTPYRNRGKKEYYGSSKKEREKGHLVDPWGTPYRYEIHVPADMGGKVEAEQIVSAGKDRRWGTGDDLVLELASRVRPEP